MIITEGTAPSPNGLGYPRIPGIYTDEQRSGWKAVTDAVHARDGVVFSKVMHKGRIAHPLNMPDGAEVVGPSPIAATVTRMYTDQQAMQPLPVPREIALDEIPATIAEFVLSAQTAIAAGFDGVEIHGANGYLLQQFLSPAANQRTDDYGGSYENRNRFPLEVVQAVADAIGRERVGIRLSPFNTFNDMAVDAQEKEQYNALAVGLKAIGIVYVHLISSSLPADARVAIRKAFGGTLILNGGYTADKAETDLNAGQGDLVAFGSPFIANPDLVERIKTGATLNKPDPTTFYTPGDKGYTDYPVLESTEVPNK
ncbi:alkene reductase [Spirosoma arcticum]